MEHEIFSPSDVQRFWAKVAVTSNETDCWDWTATRFKKGYGQFRHVGKKKIAHRVAWQLVHGQIPNGLQVCHRCDNPACCNPSHLFLGTNADNVKDKVQKGRQARVKGERNGQHRLTSEQVQSIRRRYAAGETNKSAFAREFNVTHQTIGRILLGKQWIES